MPLVSRDQSVLIVIDAQPGFYRDRSDLDPQHFGDFINRAAWLVEVAAALELPIVATTERPERNGPTAPEIERWLPPVTPVLEKGTFDLYREASIRNAIDGLERRTAVLVGMETDVCVAQSAMGFADHGYRVVVVADATFSPGVAHHHGLERMRNFIEVSSAKGLFYEWLPSLQELRHFKAEHPEAGRPTGIQL